MADTTDVVFVRKLLADAKVALHDASNQMYNCYGTFAGPDEVHHWELEVPRLEKFLKELLSPDRLSHS